jgi:hypothetical protein
VWKDSSSLSTSLLCICHVAPKIKKHGVNYSDDGTEREQKIMHDNMGTKKRGSLSYIGHTYIQDVGQ